MKLKLGVFAFLFVLQCSFSQSTSLSESAEISVLTVGPGSSLNDAFGHNAFRIKDKTKRIDLAFGYGEYDFNAPNFYLKFARGKLNYLLSKDRYTDFYNYYISQNRTIKEQVLNLTLTEKQALFNFLNENYKPEKRKYLYDFFYDNCATKMRDVLKTTVNQLDFKTPEGFEQKTFRGLIYEHVDRNSWGSFGIDLALGSVIDRPATYEEYMYLPKYVFAFLEDARLASGEKLVSKTTIIYERTKLKTMASFFARPLFVLSLIALTIILFTFLDYKKQKRSKWLDVSLFLITGAIGVFMLLLWFATDHSATAHNYNLLWAFPINLFVVLQLTKKQVHLRFIKYIKFLIVMLSLMCLHWFIGVQIYAIGLIPILIALLIRYVFLVNYFNVEKSK